MQRNAREGSPLPFPGSPQNIKEEPDTAVKYQWQFKKVFFSVILTEHNREKFYLPQGSEMLSIILQG